MIDPRSPSDRAEFARLLAAYGADRRRWPRAEHFDAFADDEAYADEFREAAGLDAMLAAAMLADGPLTADDAFKARLLDSFTRGSPRGASTGGRGARSFGKLFRFAPAGALAALSAIGFVAGSATAQVENDALYYAQAAIEAPLSEGAGFWPEEQ